jgi:sugar transferase EpsL
MTGIYSRGPKRALDLIVVALTMVVWGPLLAIVALAVRLCLGAPVFFRQTRPGLHGRPFMILKCRTMTDARDGSGELLPDAGRLTRFGRWLRSTSLDELPELLNVIMGDMSLVGPRPLLVEYLPLYTAEQARRHAVRPGITGWAQVNGRNCISWAERFCLDLWYVDNVSAKVDCWILLKTAVRVVRRQGICADSHATMPAFTGSKK